MKNIVLVLSLVLSCKLYAFNDTDVTENYVVDNQWAYGFSVTQTNFDKSVKYFGIEDSALGFSFDVDYIANNWITTLSAEYLSYDDNLEFEQDVVGSGFANKGDRSSETSDASGLLLGVAIGKLHFFGEQNDMAFFGQIGVNAMAYSERSIASCNNCYSEDIDIEGGVFLKAGFIKETNYFNLGFHARTYISGDQLNTTFGISAGSTY